jgi:hypothetical protein
VYLVVDDQAPVPGAEHVEVREDAAAPGGEHLVGGDGDRADLLALAAVLADLLLGQRGTRDQLPLPLPPGHRVGDQDQRRGAGLRHGGGADERLASPTREYDHARAAGPEVLDRLPLVRAKLPAVFAQRDRVRLAVHVPGQVLGRPTELQQGLLEPAPLRRVYGDGVLVDLPAQHPGELLRLGHLDQHDPVEAAQHEPVRRVVHELQPAVPVHRLGDVDEQRVRYGVPGEAQQRVDHRLGVVPGRPRVPQPERGQPVRVHVLGGALQLGERRDGHPAGERVRVVDLQQERLVGLNDQRATGHAASLPRPTKLPIAATIRRPAASISQSRCTAGSGWRRAHAFEPRSGGAWMVGWPVGAATGASASPRRSGYPVRSSRRRPRP